MYEPPVPGPGIPEMLPRLHGELGARIIVALPLVLGLFMLIITPSYFRPIFQSAIGWWTLALVVVLEAAAYGAITWGSRRFRASPLKFKVLTILVQVGLIFPTLWLILLGPAVVVVINAKGG